MNCTLQRHKSALCFLFYFKVMLTLLNLVVKCTQLAVKYCHVFCGGFHDV
jgi:hypothetical protein